MINIVINRNHWSHCNRISIVSKSLKIFDIISATSNAVHSFESPQHPDKSSMEHIVCTLSKMFLITASDNP